MDIWNNLKFHHACNWSCRKQEGECEKKYFKKKIMAENYPLLVKDTFIDSRIPVNSEQYKENNLGT